MVNWSRSMKNGVSRFQLLQNALRTSANLHYCVFDIMFGDGEDLRDLPLLERKKRLQSILPRDPLLTYSEHWPEHGKRLFREAQRLSLEGIMAKRAQSRYLSGARSKDWSGRRGTGRRPRRYARQMPQSGVIAPCPATRGPHAMQTKLLHEAAGKRTFAVILSTGDEAMRCLQEFAARERLGASQITAIGALSGGKLAFFDWESKTYRPIPVEEQVEVASLVGDIAIGPDGKPSVHVHAVLGRRDGTAMAGHLQEARVRPTLEIIVTESPAHLCKFKDPESGLALIGVRS